MLSEPNFSTLDAHGVPSSARRIIKPGVEGYVPC